MDRRRHSKQPRRSPGRTVRRLWMAAAAALVLTYAGLLWRASWTEAPADRAALFGAEGPRSATPPSRPMQEPDERADGGDEQLRSVEDEMPGERQDAAKGVLRVEADAAETRRDVEGTAADKAAQDRAADPVTARPTSQAPPFVPGEDALRPVHEFTGADALSIKPDVTDAAADAHLFSDASSLLVKEEADDEQGHLFTDASYFDSLAAAKRGDTAKAGTQPPHLFSGASVFDDLALAEEEEEEPPVKVARFDESRLVKHVESASETVPMEQRHDVIAGYDATIEYLAKYRTPEGSGEQLFLFFACSDANGTALNWKPDCADAKKAVYDVFARSPSTNRLVTIYAGPEEAWQGSNMLKENDDLRLKSIPSVMRWDGGAPGAKRATYGMMIDGSILTEPFLRYLFRNTDRVDERLAHRDVLTKEIVTVKGYEQYSRFIDGYKQKGESYPLFVILMSGRWKSNNRLWCQFSRQAELPLEYAFYAFAPRDARFLVVETYSMYTQWKNPGNEFKTDPELHPKGVPWFLRVYPEAGGALLFQRVKKRLYTLESLQLVFEDSA